MKDFINYTCNCQNLLNVCTGLFQGTSICFLNLLVCPYRVSSFKEEFLLGAPCYMHVIKYASLSSFFMHIYSFIEAISPSIVRVSPLDFLWIGFIQGLSTDSRYIWWQLPLTSNFFVFNTSLIRKHIY